MCEDGHSTGPSTPFVAPHSDGLQIPTVMVSPDAALKENDLPLDIDIWTEVLDQLDAPDISRLSRSSKKAAALVSHFPWVMDLR